MSIYINSTNYNVPLAHECSCPRRSLSPTSSTGSYESSSRLPINPRIPTTNLPHININDAPSYPSWNIPVEQPGGWESVPSQNTLRYTSAPQGEDSYINYEDHVPFLGPINLLELSDEEFEFYLNSHSSEPEPSASTSNRTFPNRANHLSFPKEPFKNHAVERATRNHYEYNAPMSQAGFNTVPLYTHQPSMPPPNGPSLNQINRPSYYNASFGNPTVEAQTLYDTAPPHTGFAKQTLASNYPPVERHRDVQPPIHMERYQPSQQTAQLSEPVATSLSMAGSFQGQKRKRIADTDDEMSETMDEYFDLLQQKKVIDNKIKLGPIITGKKIPHSEYVWKQETGQTTKGPSPSKSSKGKSAARDTTGKPQKGPKKPKAAKAPETEKETVGNGSRTSQDGERSAKRAKTNKNGRPKSSKPQTSGSTDGGRLVDATTVVETKMKRKSDFIHVPESQVDHGSKTTFFRYEPNFGANGGHPPKNAPSMVGDSWM